MEDSSDSFGNGIIVAVKTRYLESQSDPEKERYVFAYQITITNTNLQTVQLLRRYWLITDGNQKVQEVEGEGVVGEQPEIDPGESYSYKSGAVLNTSVGSMQGYYEMKTLNGVHFKAMIEPFTLAEPLSLH